MFSQGSDRPKLAGQSPSRTVLAPQTRHDPKLPAVTVGYRELKMVMVAKGVAYPSHA
jgi:hypothetical protein